MSFRKTASVTSLGSFTVDASGELHRTAAAELDDAGEKSRRSYYLDGSSKIDVSGILSRVASSFQISEDPSDYIYEAIRANTVNIPNDNHDGFHRDELLRFDPGLKTAVYLTYREKPHHLNHRADDPSTSRGVILDSHYNDDTPPLEHCLTCNTRTAEVSNRDASGIHCSKCGSTVKDEFVEILVAIDAHKDPIFADGVRSGLLKAGSMGCNCASTTCNVCAHVANSRAEFCEHIRGANKGTYWNRTANGWRKISKETATSEFDDRGMPFDITDLCSQHSSDGFEVRKAFEYCLGVEFDEYSRVDEPADTKCLQREVLNKAAEAEPQNLQIESEQMVARAKRKQSKQAMMFHVVRSSDGVYASEDLNDAMAKAGPEAAEYVMIDAADTLEAEQRAQIEQLDWQPTNPMGPTADDININIDTDAPGGPDVEMGEEPMPGEELMPGEMSMEDFTEEELLPGGPGEETTPESLGVMPEGASKEANMNTFADSYRGWRVQVTPAGNAQLVSPHGPVMLFRASSEPNNDEDRIEFGREILGHLWEHGLFKTADQYDALYHSRFANVVDYALDDMAEFADKQTKTDAASGGDNDMRDTERGQHEDDSRNTNDDDMDESKTIKVTESGQDRAVDHEEGGETSLDSSLQDRGSDMRDDPRKEINVGQDSALDDPITDHQERLAGKIPDQWATLDQNKFQARLQKLYASKLETAKTEADERVVEARKQAVADYQRSLRIVARRHTLNLEMSPLKESLGVILSNARTAGYDTITGQPLEYEPLPGELAVHLVEAAWKEGADAELDALINRAAELMDHDSDYLKNAESDLNKMAHRVPPVTSAAMVSNVERGAEELRREASRGNLELTASNEGAPAQPSNNTRHTIQAALSGGTRVNSLSNQYRR